jgi:hypothetical protein
MQQKMLRDDERCDTQMWTSATLDNLPKTGEVVFMRFKKDQVFRSVFVTSIDWDVHDLDERFDYFVISPPPSR